MATSDLLMKCHMTMTKSRFKQRHDVFSFVDLRSIANGVDADAMTRCHGSDGTDAFLANRVFVDVAGHDVAIGVVALAPGSGHAPNLPADEFVIVESGTLMLTAPDRSLSLAAGESVVLPHGTGFSWQADVPTTLIFMRHLRSEAGAGGVVPIDPQAPLQPSNPPSAELLIGPTPACRNHTAFQSADGVFLCGIWDSTPYLRRAQTYRHFELMHLIEGSVTFEDESGRVRHFTKGDIFLLEKDAQASWDSRDYVKKIYAIYRPA